MAGLGEIVGTALMGAGQWMGGSMDPEQKSGVLRDVGFIPQERADLVKSIIADVRAARTHWKPVFDRMKKSQDLLLGLQWDGQTSIDDEDRYVANIIQRHVQQRTAAVYAKNPTVVARRKEQMDFVIWDENPLTLQMAQQTVTMANQMAAGTAAGDPQSMQAAAMASASPEAMAAVTAAKELLADIQQGFARRAASDRLCRTVQIYFKNKVLSQQNPPFKASMKQHVRRALAAGVGYIKLGIVRNMEVSPDAMKGMATVQESLATVERMVADMIDDPAAMAELTAEKEQLRLTLEGMQKSPLIVTQEGIVFDFPSSTTIIPDKKLVHLQGFVGCDWVAEEYLFTVDQIKMLWKVDIAAEGCKYTEYNSDGVEARGTINDEAVKDKKGQACVFIVYNRTTGLTYTVCDGYKDFLEEPCPPKLKLERFFPWYPLAFNYIEHHKERFPLSDAFYLRSQQREINRSREGLRQHRIANRPLTAVSKGRLSEPDIEKLESRPDNAVVQLEGLALGQKIDDLLQTVEHPAIKGELYDVEPYFTDVLRVVGTQEANLGGTSGATATESSIAEGSRMSSLQSNMDDMDDHLTELMTDAGKVAFMEIGKAEVLKVVGPGAAWPEASAQEVADEIFLEIAAGSSGRPNKAVEVQNFTQMAPILLQIPGLSPHWLGKQAIARLDDRLDLTDAFIAGQPSIQTLNALAAKPLGAAPQSADGEPAEGQGGKGGDNAPRAGGVGGGLGPQAQNAMAPAGPPVMPG